MESILVTWSLVSAQWSPGHLVAWSVLYNHTRTTSSLLWLRDFSQFFSFLCYCFIFLQSRPCETLEGFLNPGYLHFLLLNSKLPFTSILSRLEWKSTNAYVLYSQSWLIIIITHKNTSPWRKHWSVILCLRVLNIDLQKLFPENYHFYWKHNFQSDLKHHERTSSHLRLYYDDDENLNDQTTTKT